MERGKERMRRDERGIRWNGGLTRGENHWRRLSIIEESTFPELSGSIEGEKKGGKKE